MSFRFACPHCKTTLKAPGDKIGAKVSCPKCRLQLEVPTPKGEVIDDVLPVLEVKPHPSQHVAAAPAAPSSPFNFDAPGQPPPTPAYTDYAPPARQEGFACPYCRTTRRPIVRQQMGTAGVVVMVVMILFCLPLFWIGFLIKEDYRVCSACGIKLG